MGNTLVAFLAGAGVAAWVYNKLMRTTGNNTKNSLIAAVIIGLGVWALGVFILNAIDVKLS